MKTLYETARDSLIVIESIASGSTTTNSLPHLARLAREGLTAIESADRAQQGEPVAWIVGADVFKTYEQAAANVRNPDLKPEPLYRAATKAAAPADASSQQQEKVVRVAPAPAGQHDAEPWAYAMVRNGKVEGIEGGKFGVSLWVNAEAVPLFPRDSGAEVHSRAQRTTIDNENCRAAPVPDTGIPAPVAVTWTAEEIADACVRAGLGILECNSLIVTLKSADHSLPLEAEAGEQQGGIQPAPSEVFSYAAQLVTEELRPALEIMGHKRGEPGNG